MQTSRRALTRQEEVNKDVVLNFYDRLCGHWDFEGAARYIGPSYRQHNPRVADGLEGLKQWVDNRPPFTDQLKMTVKRVLVDGEFVVLHVYNEVPTLPAVVIMEIFRLEQSKIVEHWDVIMQEPPEALHANGMT